MWNNMFEKEIKIVGKNKIKRISDFNQKDGEVNVGKVFIYYPHEIEEIKQYQTKYETLKGEYNKLNEKYIQTHETSKSLGEDVTKKTETISQLESKIKTLDADNKKIPSLEEEIQNLQTQLNEITSQKESIETQLNSLTTKHETQQKSLERLEEENNKKDEEINQLQMERDNLNDEVNGLNTTITSMKIQHDEEMDDLVSRYNKNVDMIHSLISTTSLLKGDIENMGWTKRTFGFKHNLNSIFEERNMNNLIKQHLIEEDSTIPDKLPNKQ